MEVEAQRLREIGQHLSLLPATLTGKIWFYFSRTVVLFLLYYCMLCVQKGRINELFFNNYLSTKYCKNKFQWKVVFSLLPAF